MSNKTSLLALLAVAAASLAACGADTAGGRKTFELEIAAKDRGELQLDDGTRLVVDEAKLVVGPIRFYSGEPLFARGGADRGWGRRLAFAASALGALFTAPVAHAHPGHYQEGETLAEWLETRRVDLLAAKPTSLGLARGVEGQYRSMLVTLPKPPAALGGQSLELAVTATQQNRTVRFRAAFDVVREVRGIAIDEDLATTAQGSARVEVDLHALLRRIDVAALPEASSAAAEHQALDPEGQAHNALLRGVTSTDTFTARWIAR